MKKQEIFKWNIEKEEASDSLRFYEPNGKNVLDLGCGRWGSVSDPNEYTPIFAYNRGAKVVVGVDDRSEEKPYYEEYFAKNFPESTSYFYHMSIQTPEQVKDLMKTHDINYIKSDIEGYETVFLSFSKEDLANIDTFVLEYHSFDIKNNFINKFNEWGYEIYANGEAWIPGIGVLFAKKIIN
jgi:hypothetical protein